MDITQHNLGDLIKEYMIQEGIGYVIIQASLSHDSKNLVIMFNEEYDEEE